MGGHGAEPVAHARPQPVALSHRLSLGAVVSVRPPVTRAGRGPLVQPQPTRIAPLAGSEPVALAHGRGARLHRPEDQQDVGRGAQHVHELHLVHAGVAGQGRESSEPRKPCG